MIGVSDGLKQLRVSVDTTTVLRRTPTFTGDTTWVLAVVVGWLDALIYEYMLPIVAERPA